MTPKKNLNFTQTSSLPDAHSGSVRDPWHGGHGAALQTQVEVAMVAAPNLCSPRDGVGAEVAACGRRVDEAVTEVVVQAIDARQQPAVIQRGNARDSLRIVRRVHA